MGALERWSGFLNQIAERHRSIIAESYSATAAMVAGLARGGDTAELSQHISATAARLSDLESRIDATWDSQVDAAFDAESISPSERMVQLMRGRQLRWTLEDNRSDYELFPLDQLCRAQFAHAARVSPLYCGACKTQIAAPWVGRVWQVTCHACGATQEYRPTPLQQQASAVGCHAVSRLAVTAQWRAMRAAEQQFAQQRPPQTLQAIVAVEQAMIAYYQAYWSVRCHFEPERSDIAREVAALMRPWYENVAAHEPAWRSARGQ